MMCLQDSAQGSGRISSNRVRGNTGRGTAGPKHPLNSETINSCAAAQALHFLNKIGFAEILRELLADGSGHSVSVLLYRDDDGNPRFRALHKSQVSKDVNDRHSDPWSQQTPESADVIIHLLEKVGLATHLRNLLREGPGARLVLEICNLGDGKFATTVLPNKQDPAVSIA